MNRQDWKHILETQRQRRPGAIATRAPAPAHALAALEARLGRALPASFRAFLECSDGARLGDRQVYGSAELLELCERAERRLRLLPFHPVDRKGVECLELGGDERVLWCRSEDLWLAPRRELHPLAERLVRGERSSTCEATYVDFADWAFDALLDASTRPLPFGRRFACASLN